MDSPYLRARFIKEQLERALKQADREQSARTLRAFSEYLQWHRDSLPVDELASITTQLAELARKTPMRAVETVGNARF